MFKNARHVGRKSGFLVQIIKFDFSIANFLLQGNPTNVAKKTPFESKIDSLLKIWRELKLNSLVTKYIKFVTVLNLP
jgi:hypothetical protein